MTRLVAATRSALASGRFISAWTIGASLLLSLTVMAPAVSGPAAQVFAAGFLTWVCFAAALAVLGAIERVCGRGAAPHRAARVRTTIVVVGVALIAAARPAVQDAWLRSVGVTPPEEWQLLFRVATNVAVWVVVFTAIAIVVGALRSLRDTNALLRAAVAERADLDRRTAAFDAVARDSVHRAIGDVSRALTVLAASDHAGADDVRAFAVDEVRPASHALAELAHAPVPALAPPPDPADPGSATDAPDARDPPDPSVARDPSDAAASVTRAMRLRVPPRWAVAVLYAACVLPYALRETSLLEIGAGVLVAIGGGALIDGASRHRGIRHREAVFVGGSIACAVLLALVALACGAPLGRALIAALVYAVVALGVAACAGVLRALRVEQRRLSGVVATAQRAARAGTRPAREALDEAAELLHRDLQGRCAVFALEHSEPSPDERAILVAQLRDALDEVGDVFARGRRVDPVSLDAIVATWGRVIDLSVSVTPRAQAAFDAGDPAARDAYDIVSEGVLNAVKHTGQRRADVAVDVVSTGAGAVLAVRVHSFGSLPAGAQLRPASRVASLGAVLSATPDGAVLEARLPLSGASPAAAVVSAEHGGGTHQRPL